MSDNTPKSNSNPDKTHTIQMKYQTQGQSIWTEGSGSQRWDSGNTLLIPWGHFNEKGGAYEDVTFFGTFGAGGHLDTKGKVGLRLSAKLDAGSVDIDCPLKVQLSYPTFTEVGQPVPIKTGFALDKVATLRTTTPGASATLSFHAEGNFSAGANVEAFSDKLLDFNVKWPDKGITVNQDLFTVSTTHLGAEYSYPNEEEPVFTAQLQVPDLSAAGKVSSDGRSVTGSGTDHLMALSLDLTNLLATALEDAGIEVPPFHLKLKYPSGKSPSGTSVSTHDSSVPCDVTFEYSLIDTWLEGKLGFKLDFRFTPKPRLNLVAKDGNGVRQQAYLDAAFQKPVDANAFVEVGTTLYYRMPESKILNFEPTLDYACEFSHTPNLHLTGSINMDPFKLEVGGDVADIPLPSFHWKPVKTLRESISGDVPLTTLHPALQGFGPPLLGESFSVVQQDISLPGIARVEPASATPRNQPQSASGYGPPLKVIVTSDSAPWSLEETRFYLSDSIGRRMKIKASGTSNPKQVELQISPDLLVEGVYKIIAEVQPDNLSPRTSSADFEVRYWVPTITGLQKPDGKALDSLPPGSPKTQVMVIGTGFGPLSRVFLDGKQVPLTQNVKIEPTRLSVDVPAELLQDPSSYALTVVNPEPGGGTSVQFPFTVSSLMPSVGKVTPSEPLMVNGHAVPISVEGKHFLPGATVCVDGVPLETHVLSQTMLSAQVPSELLEARRFPAAGPLELRVTVRNVDITSLSGVHTGGESPARGLQLTLPPLYVSGFEPSATTAGAPSTWISFDGDNFFGTPVVRIQKPGSPPSDAIRSSTRALEFGIPQSLLSRPQTLEIHVQDTFGGVTREYVSSFQVMKPCFFGDNDGTIYEVNSAGELIWHKDLARDGTENWAPGSGNVIGRSGWDQYLHIIPGGDGILYAVTPQGNLLWFQDLARDGTEKWAPGSGNVIGRGGWTQFVRIVSGGGGVLYPILGDGSMRWYKDLARNGTEKWASGSSNTIGKGFNAYTQVASGGGGVLYAVTPSGNLLWFHDTACNGTSQWAPGSGQTVSSGGWSQISHLLSGGDSILYPITLSGNIRWFRDVACNGTQKWAHDSGTTLGTDWVYDGAQ